MEIHDYGSVILNSSLFSGVSQADLPAALDFLGASERAYRKNAMIFMIGDPMRNAGIVLDGIVELSFLDESDNSVNMNHFSAGSIFGESLAFSEASKSPVQMQALTPCQILFLDLRNLMEIERMTEPYQAAITANLLRDFARQNVFLNQKVRIMSQRKLRDKIKVFLRQQDVSKDGVIHIRFKRNELAEFLGVNRSALSRELSAMQEDGILTVDGSNFRMLDPAFLLS